MADPAGSIWQSPQHILALAAVALAFAAMVTGGRLRPRVPSAPPEQTGHRRRLRRRLHQATGCLALALTFAHAAWQPVAARGVPGPHSAGFAAVAALGLLGAVVTGVCRARPAKSGPRRALVYGHIASWWVMLVALAGHLTTYA